MRGGRNKNGRLLSYILRHNPSKYGVINDKEGYVDIEAVLGIPEIIRFRIDHAKLHEIVANDDKGRFEIRDDKIRARYGHTFDIEMGAWNAVPPRILYHGTVRSCLESIAANGIRAQARQFVHMSSATDVAETVAKRHGSDIVVLEVDAFSLHYDGYACYDTQTGTWLTEFVPSKYILRELHPVPKEY